jgi:uncharacterized RDD family membrane protein YckC
MDPTDFDDMPAPERKPYGFETPTRLTFVPPPEPEAPEYASIKLRASALAIDALIWVAAVIPLGLLFGGFSASNGFFRIKFTGPPSLFATVLWLVYMTLMESQHGETIGKRKKGIRVVMEDGAAITPEAALIRNLSRFVDAFPYIVPYLFAILTAQKSPKVQRFGDRVAETIVVVAPASDESADTRVPSTLPSLDPDPSSGSSGDGKRRFWRK